MTGYIRARYVIIPAAAALSTIACFWLMVLLITTGITRAPDVRPSRIFTPVISPVRKPERHEVRKRPRKILPSEPPPRPEGQPLLPKTKILTTSRIFSLESMADTLGSEVVRLDISPPVRTLVPLAVIQPIYPFSAAMKEIEGFVLVQFSVDANGYVRDAVVIDSAPGRTFDDAALSAIRKFRFQPRMVGGDAISTQDIQMKFAFSMESSYASVEH